LFAVQISSLIAIVLLLMGRRRKEAQLLLADAWSDDDVELDDVSEASASSSSFVSGRRLSLNVRFCVLP